MVLQPCCYAHLEIVCCQGLLTCALFFGIFDVIFNVLREFYSDLLCHHNGSIKTFSVFLPKLVAMMQ